MSFVAPKCPIESLVSRHSQATKKLSATGADRLKTVIYRLYIDKMRTWYGCLEKQGFVEAAVSRPVRLRVSVGRASIHFFSLLWEAISTV